jgi:hypothetical protein
MMIMVQRATISGFQAKVFCTHLNMDVILFLPMREYNPMSKTSEAVIFSACVSFALLILVRMLLNLIEARCSSLVCPTLVVHQ